jgi:NADH dehydrogenase/NADH:ubiquinone oxidoreductase subunit G
MSVKTLEIDGKTLTGVAGETIFAVAWDHGIQIPRLCHVGGTQRPRRLPPLPGRN